jgi:hypothetical protein
MDFDAASVAGSTVAPRPLDAVHEITMRAASAVVQKKTLSL